MPFPAGLTLVSVHCGFDVPPDGAAAGRLRIDMPGPLTGPADDRIIAPFTRTLELDETGDGTISLPATNDPGWTPVDRPYLITCSVNGEIFRGTLLLDHATPAVELADLIQFDAVPDSGVTYATLAQLGDVIDDLADLEVEVDGKQPAGAFLPTEAGYAGWSYDPAFTQSGSILPAGGLSYVVRVRIMEPVVSAIDVHLTTPGSGLTNAFATLHNDAGARLGAGAITANQNTNLQTGGKRTMPLAVAQGVTPGDYYKIRFWVTGSVLPTLARAGDSPAINAGTAAPDLRWATADAGLTDAASAPDTIGAMTAGDTAWWLAAKS